MRCKVNKIVKLQGDDGIMYATVDDFCAIAKDYFRKLFADSVGDYGLIVHTINTIISEDDNGILLSL